MIAAVVELNLKRFKTFAVGAWACITLMSSFGLLKMCIRDSFETRPLGNFTLHSYDGLHEIERKDGQGTNDQNYVFVHDQTFLYNSRGWLFTTTSTDGTRTMGYDLVGHLKSVTESSVALSGQADVAYGYDLDGHITSEVSRGVTQQYFCDLAGRRYKVQYGTGRTVNMTYDGDGRLIGQMDGASMTNWFYDPAGQLLAKWLPNNQYAVSYTHLDVYKRQLLSRGGASHDWGLLQRHQ